MKPVGVSRITVAAGVALLLLLLSHPRAQAAKPAKTDSNSDGSTTVPQPDPNWYKCKDPREARECRRNLHRIHDAIVAFQSAHKRLPNWLSELSPDFLDANYLICPFVKKTADLKAWRYGVRHDVFEDPEESTSYAFEFCIKEMPLWTGVKTSWAEYKRRQMELLGKDVPIVRCFAHEPILNLAYGGKIFESGIDWEDFYALKYKHEDLQPEPFFFHEPPRTTADGFKPRPADIDARLLDLTPHFNAYLDETWLPYPRDCNLARLQPQVQELGGTQFDVRGLIQLNGSHLLAPYPVVVSGIRIGRSCARIQFLHGTRAIYHPDRQPYRVADGIKVASYIVRYKSGAQTEIPIYYGRDVRDWWYNPSAPDHAPAKVVWDQGEDVASHLAGRKSRLFQTTWDNPWKDKEVDSLVLVSAMAETAPFIVAITVE